MNKKGQIGTIIAVAIALIVGLILFQAAATNVEKGTRTNTGNLSVRMTTQLTAPAVGTVVELTGQELTNTPTVRNSTGGTTIGTANYTIYECARPSDGLKGLCYRSLVDPTADVNYGPTVNYSYGYYPDGYIEDAGARSIAGIIILLTAIGVAIVVLAGSKFDFY